MHDLMYKKLKYKGQCEMICLYISKLTISIENKQNIHLNVKSPQAYRKLVKIYD